MMFCAALKENNVIEKVNMSQNNIRCRGAQAIGQMLKTNSIIKEYDAIVG